MKYVGVLLAASIEVYLHHNLGRRFMYTALLAFLLCCAYTCTTPASAYVVRAFLLGFGIRLLYQFVYNRVRREHGLPEPHSRWTGISGSVWQRLGMSQPDVQRFTEPALCFALAVAGFSFDRFFSFWLAASAVSMLVKEQVLHFGTRRRVIDMADSRIEAQEFGAAVEQYLNPGRGAANRFHRARLPRRGARP